MRALVYHGPGQKAWEEVPDPDAIHIAVKDGAVTLTGVTQPGKASHEMVRGIRRIQGVVAVRSRLSYLPPGPENFDALASFPID